MANVLPYNSEPEYNLRSHLSSFMLFAAGTIGRANVPINKHVNSHAEIELPPGVLKFNVYYYHHIIAGSANRI